MSGKNGVNSHVVYVGRQHAAHYVVSPQHHGPDPISANAATAAFFPGVAYYFAHSPRTLYHCIIYGGRLSLSGAFFPFSHSVSPRERIWLK